MQRQSRMQYQIILHLHMAGNIMWWHPAHSHDVLQVLIQGISAIRPSKSLPCCM